MRTVFVCDECGCETNEEFTHARVEGTLCLDCYDKIWFKYAFQEAEDLIRKRLPTIEELTNTWARQCRVSPVAEPHDLSGNCHSAALVLKTMLQQYPDMQVKVKRGHWLGADLRPKHLLRACSQHSWLEVHLPGIEVILYVDPTQWVFLNTKPAIAVTTADDHQYDAASHRLREILHGRRELPEREPDKLVEAKLSQAAQKVISHRFGDRDWSQWTRAECFEIANENPATYGGYAREIFDALLASGFKALIPFCSYEEVYRDGNHD